jgi:hypothetical protein
VVAVLAPPGEARAALEHDAVDEPLARLDLLAPAPLDVDVVAVDELDRQVEAVDAFVRHQRELDLERATGARGARRRDGAWLKCFWNHASCSEDQKAAPGQRHLQRDPGGVDADRGSQWRDGERERPRAVSAPHMPSPARWPAPRATPAPRQVERGSSCQRRATPQASHTRPSPLTWAQGGRSRPRASYGKARRSAVRCVARVRWRMAPPRRPVAVVELLRSLVRAASPSGRERPAVEAFAAALRDLGCDRVEVDGVGNAVGTMHAVAVRRWCSTATSTPCRRATPAPGRSTRSAASWSTAACGAAARST